MGIVSLAVLGLTAVGLFFGAIFGLIRGRGRAFIRLILVVLSAVAAFALRGTVVDFVMAFEIEGASLQQTILEAFTSEGAALPAGLTSLIFALIEIVIGFAAYFILLFVFRFLSWLLLFPFLKIIIRKIEKKRAKKAYEASEEGADFYALKRRQRKKLIKKQRHRGAGALIGLAQGVLVAYFLFAPLTGLLVQVDKIANIQMNGEALFELPEEIGIQEYTESTAGKIFTSTGGWFFNAMTTTVEENGNEVSLEGTLGTAETLLGVLDATSSLEQDLGVLTDPEATPNDRIAALNNLGDKLITVGDSIATLDNNTMDMIQSLVSEMAGEEISQEELEEVMAMLTPEFFTSAGNGIKAFATYEQIKLDDSTLTAEQAKDIVEKAYACIDIAGGIELEIKAEHKPAFKTAIESIEGITAEDKNTMFNIFGIQA